MRTEQGAIALSNISVTDGSMTFKGITAPSSITITSSGSLMQGSSAKTAVDFVAQPVCTDGVYCEADIKWYVNGELGGSGLKYSYTPPNVNGTYAVTAKSGGIVSNEIIISVGQLYLPEAPEKEHAGQQFVGYHVNVSGNSMLLEAGSPFMGNANELKEIEPVWLSFEMADGAAVRMTAPAGLRFTTKVKYDEYSALVAAAGLSNVSFGTIIAPADYIGYGRNIEELTLEALAEWGGAYLKIPSTRWYDSDYSVNDGYYTYTGVIWNVLSSNYNRPFSGRGYVCVTYSDGTVKNFYTPHDENNNSRAVCDVAYAALTDSTAPYTEQQRSVMKTFVDGVVNITADGQPAWTGNSGYESPYVADQLITTEVISVIVSPKSGYSWNASDVRAVTYDGVRLMPQQYEVSGNDIVITIER